MKRFIDFVLSLTALVILSPLFAIAAIAIKLDSRGPVFFHQERMGRGMRTFKVFKFRTMSHTPGGDGPLVTVQHDPRITKVGAFLRRTKFDEFPQLFNVLIGDMSLVGPRPEVRKYVEMFADDYSYILRVRPGLTDPASFKYRNEGVLLAKASDPEQEYVERILPDKVRMARAYVVQAHLTLDLVLIMKTLLEAVGMEVTSVSQVFLRHRRPVIVAIHLALVVLSYYFAWSLRFDGQIPAEEMRIFWSYLPWFLAIRAVMFAKLRLYQGLWRYTGLSDGLNIVAAVVVSAILLVVVVRGFGGELAHPRSVFIIDAFLLITFMSALRLGRRAYHELFAGMKSVRVLVVGAADAGELAIRELKTSETHLVVGLIDDDRQKLGRRIHGVPVLGGHAEIPRLVADLLVDEVMMAIDPRHEAVVHEVAQALTPLGVKLTVRSGLNRDSVARHSVVPAAERKTPEAPDPDGFLRHPCPRCQAAAHRSRAGRFERAFRKAFTAKRLFRCSSCGWRGWLLPIDTVSPSVSTSTLPPPDLDALDGISGITTGVGPKDSGAPATGSHR